MNLDWADRTAPSLEEISAIAEKAFNDLPTGFLQQCGDVILHVADYADASLLASVGVEDPLELTGLYEGVDIIQRSMDDIARTPSHLHLFRLPLIAEWADRGDITMRDLVLHVLVHEIGHHFGMSDADMHAIEAASD